MFPHEPQRWPVVLRQQTEGEQLVVQLALDPELVWFAGHFPEMPLLPGVVQIHLAIHHACRYWAIVPQFGGMEMVKFQHPLRPGCEVTLRLNWQPENRKLSFSFVRDGVLASSGRIKL
jgi:3-hydroxymyristoyl/3-hydroxydecanoyl-(acyl carrier protein) dehydratase